MSGIFTYCIWILDHTFKIFFSFMHFSQSYKHMNYRKLGPRRKMTSAIARWHSNAPLRSTVECAYADKLEVEMQELGVKLTEALQALQQTKTQVSWMFLFGSNMPSLCSEEAYYFIHISASLCVFIAIF